MAMAYPHEERRSLIHFDFLYTSVPQLELTIKKYLKSVVLENENYLRQQRSLDLNPYNLIKFIPFSSSYSDDLVYFILPNDIKLRSDEIGKLYANDNLSLTDRLGDMIWGRNADRENRNASGNLLAKKISSMPSDMNYGIFMEFGFGENFNEAFAYQTRKLSVAVYDQSAVDQTFGIVSRRKTEVVALGPHNGLRSSKATLTLQSVLEKIAEHELRTSTPFI